MRKFVKPRILVLAALAALSMAALACRPHAFDVEDVVEILNDNGYPLAEKLNESVPFTWQSRGITVDVNGEPIVIYRYDDKERMKEGMEAIDKILDGRTGFWEVDRSSGEEVYYDNGFILVFFGGHKDTVELRQLLDAKIPCQPVNRLDCRDLPPFPSQEG